MNPDPRPWPSAVQLLEADGPVDERGGIVADDHDLVADRLHDPRVLGQRVLDVDDEPLDDVDGVLVADLLDEARVSREVREGERDPQTPEFSGRAVAEVVSVWPMTSCSMKCASSRLWSRSIIGEVSGSSSRAMPSISSAIGVPGRPRA